jgi:adenylosuccinate synthase
MFGPKTHCVVVVGAQWGDEGKGKVVDVLAERADVVVRYQGGANAGHTVDTGVGEFVLHQIPSGILHGRARCVIGNGVVLDPETLFAEIEALADRGISLEDRLLVSDRAHLVLPYHKLLEAAHERSEKIGTTGRGVGPAYEDKIGRRGLRVGELRNLDRARRHVRERAAAVNQTLDRLGAPGQASADEHETLLERLAPRLLPLAADTGRFVRRHEERSDHRSGLNRRPIRHDTSPRASARAEAPGARAAAH